jgi:hypothetical protein
MKVILFLKNLLGVFLFFVVILFFSQLLNYLSPELITLGWMAYIGVAIFQSIIIGILQLVLLSIFYPLYKLISSRRAKLICAIIGVIGFIYSVKTPWQFANVTGYNFITLIWCITLTLFTSALFYGFILVIYKSQDR